MPYRCSKITLACSRSKVLAWRESRPRRLRRGLAGILDLERLLSRVTLETANPRDLLALAASLARIPAAKSALADLHSLRLESLHRTLDDLADVRSEIERTIVTEPPIALN